MHSCQCGAEADGCCAQEAGIERNIGGFYEEFTLERLTCAGLHNHLEQVHACASSWALPSAALLVQQAHFATGTRFSCITIRPALQVVDISELATREAAVQAALAEMRAEWDQISVVVKTEGENPTVDNLPQLQARPAAAGSAPAAMQPVLLRCAHHHQSLCQRHGHAE